MGLIALPLPADWTCDAGCEAYDTYHIRLAAASSFSDLFDDAVNYLTGGDGEKTNGWNLLNSANLDAIDSQTSNAGQLTMDHDATNTVIWQGTFSGPYFYRNIVGDFDLSVHCDHNGDASYEMMSLVVRDPAKSAGEDWFSIQCGFDGQQKVSLQKNVNDVFTSAGTASSAKYLRIVRSGGTLTGYWKANSGDAWTKHEAAHNDFASGYASSVQVGILVQTQNTSDNFVGKLDYFTFASGGAVLTDGSVAESPWIPCPYTMLDATAPIAIAENHLDGTGSIAYQYAVNGGAYNGSWVTLAAMNTALAETAITDATNSVRIKVQFTTDGAQQADIMIASSIKASGTPEGGASGGLLVHPGMGGGIGG